MTAVNTTLPKPAGTTQQLTKRDRVRIAVASTIGTTIEFYDFYIYATAAVSVVRDSVFKHESTGQNKIEQVNRGIYQPGEAKRAYPELGKRQWSRGCGVGRGRRCLG